MAELKPCQRCGGKPEYYTEFVETAFGDRKGVAVRCTDCKARTYLYLYEDIGDVVQSIENLWNQGCIGRAEDG